MAKRKKKNQKKRFVPKSQYENEKPIDKADLIVEKLPLFSTPKLLVTALALKKKSENILYNKRERESMLVIARYIAQILQDRLAQTARG